MDLITACERNNRDDVIGYLERKPYALNGLYEKYFEKCTPLYYAAEYGHYDIVNMLLMRGADANICSSKSLRLPIHVACKGGFVDIVKSLCGTTGNINHPDEQGCTAFHLACQSAELSCIEVLIEKECNIYAEDETGKTGLDHMMRYDHVYCVRFLLSRFPDLMDHKDKLGRSAFHHACEYGALNSVRCLIQNFRGHASLTDNAGALPVHLAAESGSASVLKEVLVKGLYVINEAVESSCNTIAHCAAKSKSLECLHVALEFKPDLTIQNNSGFTVQHIACMNKRVPAMMVCLKNHGATFDTIENESHDTPIYSARKAGNFNNFEKAMKGEITCEFCERNEERIVQEMARNRMTVHKRISDQKAALYDKKIPQSPQYTARTEKEPLTGRSLTSDVKRDMVSRIYGEHSLFGISQQNLGNQ